MEPLELKQPERTRRELLRLAEDIPGAWMGLKIAALLLVVEGQRPGWIAEVLGLTRMSLTRWIHGVNQKGVQALRNPVPVGRSSQMSADVKKALETHLEKSPLDFGLNRPGWDGPTLAQHVARQFGIKLKVRQAQRWMHVLGYRLKRASYVYIQAKADQARKFRAHIKKTQTAGA